MATDQNHTPGPWAVSTMTMSAADWAAINIGEMTIVRAKWDGHKGDVIACVWSDGEHSAQANGMVVAAAPTMLAALELIVSNYDSGNYAAIDMPQARAAIAQARGAK